MSVPKRHFAALLSVMGALAFATLSFGSSAGADPAPYPSDSTAPGNVVVSTTNPPVGGDVSLQGDGATPGGTVSAELHTAVYDLGSTTADSSGHFSFTVKLPAGVSGQHHLIVTDVSTGTVLSDIALNIGGSGAGGVAAGGGGSGGGTAYTGAAVVGIGVLGVALLLGGAAVLMAGRRRKVSA
jgi:hypothetical protein